MVLIHFYLKNPVLVGKKKSQNVQFLTEVSGPVANAVSLISSSMV